MHCFNKIEKKSMARGNLQKVYFFRILVKSVPQRISWLNKKTLVAAYLHALCNVIPMWPFLLGSLYHLAEKNRINTIFLVEDVVGNAIEEFLVFSCICRFVCLCHCHHQVMSFQKIYGLWGLKWNGE